MKSQEGIGLFSAHISLQKGLAGLRKIDDDQSIHDVTEVRIDAEPQELPAQLQIVFEENGYAPATRFKARNQFRQILNVVD